MPAGTTASAAQVHPAARASSAPDKAIIQQVCTVLCVLGGKGGSLVALNWRVARKSKFVCTRS